MLEQVFDRYSAEDIRSSKSTADFIANLIAEIRPTKPHQVLHHFSKLALFILKILRETVKGCFFVNYF